MQYDVLMGQVDIYSVTGARVGSQLVNMNATVQTLDLTGMEPGFYVAVITDGGRFVAAKKFIKAD